MIQITRLNILILVIFSCCGTAAAQHFSIRGRLDTITASGFYSIEITPELSTYVEDDFRDLRIAEAAGKFIPYILRTASPSFSTQDYLKLPVIKNELADSGRTVLILQNNTQQKINHINLLLRNAAVTRTAAISGSDDMHQWFTIDEDIYLQKAFITDSDRYVQTIQFPASSYKYLKIIIDNRKNNPLNIIEAGINTNVVTAVSQPYIKNPSPAFHQNDSADNITYLHVHQYAFYHIERIRLAIKAPHLYKRDMDVVTSKGIASFELLSGKEQYFEIPSFNDTNFVIKIYNGDNPPLQIDTVVTEQENTQAVAYLEAGRNYFLFMNDSSVAKPIYDLKQFKDSIGYNIPSLHILSFEKLHTAQPAGNTLFSKKWIWPAIIFMLAALVFFTLRLTREVNKRNV